MKGNLNIQSLHFLFAVSMYFRKGKQNKFSCSGKKFQFMIDQKQHGKMKVISVGDKNTFVFPRSNLGYDYVKLHCSHADLLQVALDLK